MADWIGFTVGENDSLPVGKIQEIIGWCAGPKIVLEAAQGTGSDVLQSLMTVLPVQCIEVHEIDFNKLKTELDSPEIEWIIKGQNPGDVHIGHINQLVSNPQTICLIDPNTIQADMVLAASPWAISLTCVESENPALKDFDHWNLFFEEMEMNS